MQQYNKINNLIKKFVVVSDFVLLNALLYVIILLHNGNYALPVCFNGRIRLVFIIANFSMAFAETFYSSIIHQRRISYSSIVARVFRLSLTQVVIMYVALKISTFNAPIFRFMVTWGISLFVILEISRLIERWMIKYFRVSGKNSHKVILIGEDPSILLIYDSLINDAATGYRVAGYYANNEIQDKAKGLKYLGNIQDLNNDMKKQERLDNTDDVFCSLSHDENEVITGIMRYCDRNVIHFFYVPRMVGNFNLNLKLERLGDIPLFTNHEEPLMILSNRFIKRCFDLIFSSIIIICIIPFIPIIALIIEIQSPGPIFFSQERTGINGRKFKLYKFRSMHVNDKADKLQATKDDPRKFSFGNFMRKTNIDELPQFFNVFVGDMSVVGPRPHMLYHTEIYSNLIEKYMVRHFAKPGITGWAQVTGWRGETSELWQMEKRVKCDIWYVENWSFLLDLRIIFRTIVMIIRNNDKKAY